MYIKCVRIFIQYGSIEFNTLTKILGFLTKCFGFCNKELTALLLFSAPTVSLPVSHGGMCSCACGECKPVYFHTASLYLHCSVIILEGGREGGGR